MSVSDTPVGEPLLVKFSVYFNVKLLNSHEFLTIIFLRFDSGFCFTVSGNVFAIHNSRLNSLSHALLSGIILLIIVYVLVLSIGLKISFSPFLIPNNDMPK